MRCCGRPTICSGELVCYLIALVLSLPYAKGNSYTCSAKSTSSLCPYSLLRTSFFFPKG